MARLSKEIKEARRKRRLEEAIERRTFREQLRSINVDTFTKALVALIVIVALVDLQLSYILAFMDKIQIAESLSKQVCTTILGTALIYMIRAYFDSKAEYGNGVSKETSGMLDKHIKSKISSVLSDNDNTTIVADTITPIVDIPVVTEDPLNNMNDNDNANSVG